MTKYYEYYFYILLTVVKKTWVSLLILGITIKKI